MHARERSASYSLGWFSLIGAALVAPVSRTLVFDRFRFKLRTRELLRIAEDGSETPIPLGLRTVDVLLFFLERPGELLTKS